MAKPTSGSLFGVYRRDCRLQNVSKVWEYTNLRRPSCRMSKAAIFPISASKDGEPADLVPFTHAGEGPGANRKNPDQDNDFQGFHPGKRKVQKYH